jgi:hypothetical protein
MAMGPAECDLLCTVWERTWHSKFYLFIFLEHQFKSYLTTSHNRRSRKYLAKGTSVRNNSQNSVYISFLLRKSEHQTCLRRLHCIAFLKTFRSDSDCMIWFNISKYTLLEYMHWQISKLVILLSFRTLNIVTSTRDSLL